MVAIISGVAAIVLVLWLLFVFAVLPVWSGRAVKRSRHAPQSRPDTRRDAGDVSVAPEAPVSENIYDGAPQSGKTSMLRDTTSWRSEAAIRKTRVVGDAEPIEETESTSDASDDGSSY